MIGMWKVLHILLLLKFHFVYGKLIGDHICLTEKIFLVNITEIYTKNITIRQYRWCFNYPPRCSYYTSNKVDDTRIVEKNETHVIEECCPSFIEKQDHCVSPCPNCSNGICENGHCNCFSGFKGKSCDLECPLEEWGPNCSRACECNKKKCDSITGTCLQEAINVITTEVPQTIITPEHIHSVISTETILQSDTNDVQNFTTSENIPFEDINEDVRPTDIIFKQNIGSGVITLSKNVKSQNFTTQNNTYHSITESTEKNILTSTSSATIFTNGSTENNILDTALPETSNEQDKNVSRNSMDFNKPVDVEQQMEIVTKNKFHSKTFANGTIATKAGLLIPVEIKYEKVQTSPSNTHNSQAMAENHSNENVSVGNEEYLNRHISENQFSSKDFAIFGITVTVAFMLVVSVLSVNIVRKRKKHKNLQSTTNHQVAVFSASIFHSLPPGIREYEYDHPSSTGTYSAASVFNPLEPKNNPTEEFSTEPLYDEIPQKEYEQDANGTMSIYINTFGRTKL